MDLLSDILSRLRLTGTLYFRTSFTSPWGVKVPSFQSVSRFHFAHKGACFVRIAGVEHPVPLQQGDLIIISRGAGHTLYCDPTTEEAALPLDDVVNRSGFTGNGVLMYGEPGTNQETQLVCGHFAFDPDADHPLLEALPPFIHVRNYGETAGRWMENTLRVIGAEAGREQLGGDLIALKLSEIVFAQALRSYLQGAGADRPVLAAFADPDISRALKAIHDAPDHPWSLDELAGVARMSRTSFAGKFTRAMAMPPLGYITRWRMQLARQLLVETHAPVIEIAERVGYHSEAAFGRVFKRTFDTGPAAYRRSARPSA